MRLLLFVALLTLVLLLPFLALGDRLDLFLGGPELAALFAQASGWGWLVGLSLLAVDLVLPIPATGVMAALGVVYGPVTGGLLSVLGSVLAGSLGYLGCRGLSPKVAARLLGPGDFDRALHLSERMGAWLVAGSRALPLLPEIVACAAGLVHMPAKRFFLALACGALPTGFAYAMVGYLGTDQPILTLIAATVAPLALWWVLRRLLVTSLRPGHDPVQQQGQAEGSGRQDCG